jgi:hypothetical protein
MQTSMKTSDSTHSSARPLVLRPATVKSVEVSEQEARRMNAPAAVRPFYEVASNTHPPSKPPPIEPYPDPGPEDEPEPEDSPAPDADRPGRR